MPSYEHVDGDLTTVDAELLVVPAFAGGDGRVELGTGADEVGAALEIDLAAELAGLGFEGKRGEVARIPTRERVTAELLVVAGLGDRDEADGGAVRAAAAAAAGTAERRTRLATTLHRVGAGALAAVVEGVELAAYRFHGFKTDATPHELERVLLVGGSADGLDDAVAVAEGVTLVRDLVNLPPGEKRPPELAGRAQELVADLPVEIEVLDEQALRDGGYGGLLGVGAGSSAPPRLVELRYRPEAASRHLALVGKGITFDSGGLSLKPSESMETMKVDMAGAATVLGVVVTAARLRLPVALTGLLALAENMPSGGAIRPSDVLRTRGGVTVEVLNTDAEGRLVLADALAHAAEREPAAIVDVATLTGAAVTALGDRIGVVISRDDDLADALLAAGERVDEPFWRLPLALEQYGDDLEGDVADVRNAGWKGAGTIRAAIFLERFVPDGVPWAHLDIAGVAWTDEHRGWLRKGATGVPVRLLVDWLRRQS